MNARQISRKNLYDLVWSMPMREACKQFNVSDVALRKVCVQANIPVPAQGHWNKVQAGKPVRVRPLPLRGLGKPDIVLVGAQSRSFPPLPSPDRPLPPPPVFDELESEIQVRAEVQASQIHLSFTMTNPHWLIARLLKDDEARRAEQKARGVQFSWNTPRFKQDSVDQRRLRLANGLLKASSQFGIRWSIEDKEDLRFSGWTQRVRIGFSVTRLQSKGRKDAHSIGIFINPASAAGQGPQWVDGRGRRLEDCGTAIIAALFVEMELGHRAQALLDYEWMQERHKDALERIAADQAAAERQRREEIEKRERNAIERLVLDAKDFRRAAEIRAYVEAVKAAHGHTADAEEDERLEVWRRWALAHADRLDPIASRRNLYPDEE